MTIDIIKKTAYGLNNLLRLKIMKILSSGPKTANEVFIELKGYKSIYRQSVHRALELLRECDLILKVYDPISKRLEYSLKYQKIIINLVDMKINSHPT